MNKGLVIKYYSVILLLCGVFTSAWTQRHHPYIDHLSESYLSLYSGLGISQLYHSTPSMTARALPFSSVGVGYEWHQGLHQFWTLGGELAVYRSRLLLAETLHSAPVMIDNDDSPYRKFTMHYELEELKENERLIYLNLPLMYGYKSGRFYALGGAKLGIHLYASYKTKALLTSTGEYEWFFDDFEEMPNHFFVNDNAIEDKGKLGMGMNLSLSGELGYYIAIDKHNNDDLRLGLQVDYGLLDIHRQSNLGSALLRPNENPLEFGINSLQSTSLLAQKIQPLVVSVKLTYLFCTKSKWDCHCY